MSRNDWHLFQINGFRFLFPIWIMTLFMPDSIKLYLLFLFTSINNSPHEITPRNRGVRTVTKKWVWCLWMPFTVLQDKQENRIMKGEQIENQNKQNIPFPKTGQPKVQGWTVSVYSREQRAKRTCWHVHLATAARVKYPVACCGGFDFPW